MIVTRFILVLILHTGAADQRIVSTQMYQTEQACQLSGEVLADKSHNADAEIQCAPVPYNTNWDEQP